MRAYQVESFGIDGLALRDVPEPTPADNQVLVKVEAASLNFRDLMMVKGFYDKNMPLPLIPLSDGAGTVEAVGKAVTSLKPGDRVAGSFFQSWAEGPYSREKSRSPLGGPLPGALAEYVVLEEACTVPLPAHLSFEEGATLPCAAVTAWNALFEGDPVKPGETVLIQGTGGVSIFALQLARAAGANVVAISSSDEKLERLKALGVSAGINYKESPNWGAEVRKLTGGGVDCVVEVGGAGTMNQSLDAVSYGGRIAVIGVLAGVVGEIAMTTILRKCIRIRGIFVGSAEMFRSMNAAIEASGQRPVIGATYGFEQAVEALRLMESAGHFGKIVIKTGS